MEITFEIDTRLHEIIKDNSEQLGMKQDDLFNLALAQGIKAMMELEENKNQDILNECQKISTDEIVENIVYKNFVALEKKGNRLIDVKEDHKPTFEGLEQDNKILLQFVTTYLDIVPVFKDMLVECQKVEDSEVFRKKIIDREIRTLKKYIEIYEVGEIVNRPTDIEILKIQTKGTLETIIKVFESLKATYKTDEDTLKIPM